MNRLGFIAFTLGLLMLSACISDPPKQGDKKNAGGANAAGNNDAAADKDNPILVMETSMGTVKMELFEKAAPITVENFLKYVNAKHYDGTIFHRVIPNFMIQGGGFEPGMRERTDRLFPPIKNESTNGLVNLKGTLAMARTGDPDSATAQFFINVQNNSGLDRANAEGGVGYAVFGKVTEGMDVVNKIRLVETRNARNHQNVPEDDVIIKSIRRVDAK